MNPGRSVFFGLAVLTCINLFNYLDRYVVSALVETLKHSELALSDAQAGLLMTGFVVVYMFASPVCGVLGDRFSRPKIVASGVAVWSVATALGGVAGSFLSLFAARAAVGIGEAAYGTAAPSLLADYFPPASRGRIYAVFFSAIPIGTALGYVIGGFVGQHYGWRAAFFVAGIPGLLLAALSLLLWDPPRGRLDPVEKGPPAATGWAGYGALARNASFVRTVAGYSAYTFGLGGLAFWMPAFLERVRGLPKDQSATTFGLIIIVTGFLGTFIGGWLGDWLLKRNKHAYLWISGVATLLAVPFTIAALCSPSPAVYWTGMVIAELLLFSSTGPVNSLLVSQVAPTQRAVALAATNFTIHILGDVPSPPLIGWISDRSSLQEGVLLVPIFFLLSGAIWTWSALKERACTA